MRIIEALRTAVCLQFLLSLHAVAAAEFDLVIQGGRIVDGTSAPWYVADIGIRDGRITRIGRIESGAAGRSINAEGLVVAPGFVDMMGQSATPLMQEPQSAINLLTQGITTINCGEGASAAPLGKEAAARLGYATMAEYFQLLEMKGLPVNVAQTIGHTQVRRIVLGDVDRRPTDAELEQMQALVREAMECGATGVSTALIYPPAVCAQTEEIAALAEVAGQYGGRYYTHMRNEGDQLLEAIDEALEIGRQGNTPVHIFHLKAAGRQNWGKMQLAIARIKAARSAGQQVAADVYPYINNGLGIAAFIHPRHFSEGREKLIRRLDDETLRTEIRKEIETTGGWENWFRHVGNDWNRVVIGQTGDTRYSDLTGQTVAEMAKARDEDPWDTFFNLVRSGAFALPQSMTDANKILAMQQEFVSFCTDVGPAGGSRIASHPRAFGSFPRLLSRYVRDLGAISLERAIAQASAVATNEILARNRGRIAEGLAADIIVFDYEQLTDRATFSEPGALATGMKFVVVNGQLVLDGGKFTGKLPGRVLRGPGWDPKKAPSRISSGTVDPRMNSFDRMMSAFLDTHRVPGAAVAVTDQDRLVYARGFGYADITRQEQVQPASLFRIASISKPVTAVATLQLIERDKLKLDDRLFDILKLDDAIAAAGDNFDVQQRDITIRHLLEHRGGWDRNKSFDAMFQSVRFAQELSRPAPAGPHDVIQAMLRQKLDFAPGQRYAYSNYGYCLLGRVIEQLTDQSYEDYVRQHVLAPLGITSMRIGRTHLEERSPSEVRYYHPGTSESVFQQNLNAEVPSQYGGWCLEAMDSHGGWIASAVDLARFAAAFTDPENCPILSAESIRTMHARPPGLAGHDEDGTEKPVYYSLGWSNRALSGGRMNYWHTGSLPGTATILIRRHDGRNFVALLNTRVSPTADHLGRAIDSLLHKAANEVTDWPAENHFDEF
ncbi:MAG: serine hydrolase [Planctomycetota bacterium]|jgi:N-acyl-D-amino-acid deacylase